FPSDIYASSMDTKNRILLILRIGIGLLAALWVVYSSTTLQQHDQVVSLITFVMVALLMLICRKLPIDFKVLSVLLCGYALAGKGFADLTPFDPVYVGEIVLVLCVLGLIFRYFSGA